MERRSPSPRSLPALWAVPLLLAACAASPRLVDSDPVNGFALYRSGRLSPGELAALCRQGVAEILILDGTGGERECELRRRLCPGLAVRYDRQQEASVPLSADFLRAFDAWVAQARRYGLRIAFRCRHGWHRAGRLAAYYQMRFQGWSLQEAIARMNRAGRFMWRHPYLEPQVRALADHIAGRPCSVSPEHCVRPAGGGGLGSPPTFPADACPAPRSD